MQSIHIVGASENNLKQVSLDIPKGKLVVFTGVSGSGKTSLALDTIAAEAERQLGLALPAYTSNRLPLHSAPRAQVIDHLTPAVVVEQRPFTGDARSTVGTMTGAAPLLRLLFSRCAAPSMGSSSAYSFNDPQGCCPACSGLGYRVEFDLDRVLDCSLSLNQGAIRFPGHQVGSYQWQIYAHSGFFDPDKPLKDLTEREWYDFLHGSGRVVEIDNRTGKVWGSYTLTYEGLLDRITRLYLRRGRDSRSKDRILRDFTRECECPMCHGDRLSRQTLRSLLCGYNIAQMSRLELRELAEVLRGVTDPVGVPTARRLIQVLAGIEDMGLGYLTLGRPSRSLSGGEAQRLKMVRHLGSSLTGLTYIFDEPAAGLHPQDVQRLCRLLLRLRDRGNTVLVVEHNREIIRQADRVVDLGPGAGREGGRIVFEGTPAALRAADTPTARALRTRAPLNHTPRQANGWIEIEHASLHNLRDVSVRIPKNALTVVTGVAGSGKSSLVCGELLRQHPEAVHISQAPIGTSSRSNPATYTGVMDEIRRLFARENRVEPGWFSSNSKGACPVCAGKGVIQTEMAFMDPVTVPCEACGGARFNPQALGYRLRGKTILDVMQMTLDEAAGFFDQPKITGKLETLRAVGLGYMTLGQPTDTLSGGECQRIKLAAHRSAQNGLYVLDEPAAGLHGADVARLIGLLEELVARGNTVVVAEHDQDVIRRADYIIDLGPGGGKEGGCVLFSGTPAALLDCPDSATAAWLRQSETEQA